MKNRICMKDYLKPDSVVSEVRMTRTKNKMQTYILVEGVSDIAFFKNIIDKSCCRIKFCDGKENVIKAISICNRVKIIGVIGIADRDFDLILGIDNEIENLFFTDTHDIETMALKDGAFERINNEYGDDNKIELFEKKYKKSLFKNIIDVARYVGVVRLTDKMHNYQIGINDMIIKDFIDDSLVFSKEEYVNNAIQGSKQKNNKHEVIEQINKNLLLDYDDWQICRGHDLAQIIAIYYSSDKKESVGNDKARYINQYNVESALRLSYDLAVFYNSDLYRKIMQWQYRNCDMKILAKINNLAA